MVAMHLIPPTVLTLLCVLAVLHRTQASLSSTPVTLSTSLGDVVGVRKTTGAGLPMVEVFYGIPFAKPPTGNRRFRAPEAAEPWGSSPFDGTMMPPACWQAIDTYFDQFEGVDMWNPNAGRDEDCLYLNVWRPQNGASNSYSSSGDGEENVDRAGNKTIMVWIFGGGFYSGSATLDVYEASQLAVREDVIVVTIAYRTGPMGFLYLGNSDVPGNAGLLDQQMALKWVKDNAVNLGGSPDDITIFGESAGAASVGLHLLSPMSRDLFTRAIMESTSPTAYWAVMDTTKARARTEDLARELSCLNTTSAKGAKNIDDDLLLQCLQAADPSVMTDKQWYVTGIKWFDVTFGPIVDGTFLPQEPLQMLQAGDIKLTDVIVGVNRDEGIYFDLYGFYDEFKQLQNNGHLNDTQFNGIMLEVADNNQTFKDELIEAYTRVEGDNHLDILDAVSGDSLFKCSVVDFAREYTRVGGQVYMYSFEENFSSNPWPDWMGVPHGYEIELVFGIPVKPGSNNTQEEKDLTLKVMQLWANFSRTGSPNGYSNEGDWPMYTSANAEYVVIDASGLHTETQLRREQCEMWAGHHQPTRPSDSSKSSSDGIIPTPTFVTTVNINYNNNNGSIPTSTFVTTININYNSNNNNNSSSDKNPTPNSFTSNSNSSSGSTFTSTYVTTITSSSNNNNNNKNSGSTPTSTSFSTIDSSNSNSYNNSGSTPTSTSFSTIDSSNSNSYDSSGSTPNSTSITTISSSQSNDNNSSSSSNTSPPTSTTTVGSSDSNNNNNNNNSTSSNSGNDTVASAKREVTQGQSGYTVEEQQQQSGMVDEVILVEVRPQRTQSSRQGTQLANGVP